MPPTLSPESVLDLAAGTALGQNVVLRVKDDAFAAEYIVEGDYLVLNYREPEPGDLILVNFEGGANAVGTYERDERGSHWIVSREPLIPRRTFVPPVVDECVGVVVAIVRNTRKAA